MPVLQPAELWKRTGRYEIDELFKLQDRRGAELTLAMTHEEVITFHISREVRSYRDLPKLLYHFQVKERDEPRPRAGVLRTREFIMKDAYSFDRDEAGLDESYERHIGAYDAIFDRTGLEWYRVEADVGMMGGSGAHEYMAPCAAGENDVALSDAGYAANVEVASGTPRPVDGLPEPLGAPEPVETPAATTIDAVTGLLGVPAGALIKAMPTIVEGRGPVLVLVRGDHRLNEIKLQNGLGAARAARRGGRGARAVRQRARLHRPGRRARRRDRGRGAARPARPRHGRQRGRPAPARGGARARLRGELGRRAARRGRRPLPRGRRDPHRARHRGGQHLQARHPLLGAARRPLPGRAGQGAADRDGLLRHRPGAHHRRGDRAVQRRAGHRLAARRGALRRRADHARQGRRAGPRGRRRASTRSCAARDSTCSTTTATAARGRSSPTPSCWAARCGSRSASADSRPDRSTPSCGAASSRASLPLDGAAQAAAELWATLP